MRGKRVIGAEGNIPVFGMKKRDGGVYVEIVTNYYKEELTPTIHTDGWRAYDGLILNAYDNCRVFVNGIESFWSYCKRRLF